MSILDHVIVAIREGRFSKSEVSEILQELNAAYPARSRHGGLTTVLIVETSR